MIITIHKSTILTKATQYAAAQASGRFGAGIHASRYCFMAGKTYRRLIQAPPPMPRRALLMVKLVSFAFSGPWPTLPGSAPVPHPTEHQE